MDSQTVSPDELHIRAVTTLIHALGPQVKPATKSVKNAALSAANYVAILLSRGVDVQTKRNLRIMVRPVAVVTSIIASRWEILVTSSATVAAHPEQDTTIANPDPDASHVMNLSSVTARKVTLAELSQSTHRDLDLTFEEHAEDLLAAFSDYRASPSSKKAANFYLFITRRCWPVIAHRLTADRFVFGDYSISAFLETWKPEPTDTFPPNVFITVPDFLVGFLAKQSNAESFGLVHGDAAVRAKWTRETAPQWIAWLGRTLRLARAVIAKSALKPTKDGELPSLSVKKINKGASILKFLQSFSRLPMSTLLRAESIAHELQAAHTAYILAENKEMQQFKSDILENRSAGSVPSDTPSSSLELASEVDSDQREEYVPEGDEVVISLVERFLANVVAWQNAVDFIISTNSLWKTSGFDLRIRLLTTPSPKKPEEMADLIHLLTLVVDKLGNRHAWDRKGKAELLKWATNASHAERLQVRGFVGTIHAEASLMGLLTEPSVLGDQNDINLLAHAHAIIGVSKKCCWSCAQFAAGLNTSGSSHKTFMLPGSHGQVFPWSPPPYGFSPDVASYMRHILDEELQKTIWEGFCQADAESQMSSGLGGETEETIMREEDKDDLYEVYNSDDDE